jgi:UPF0176 protein
MTFIVATFYKFFAFPDCGDVRESWLRFCEDHHVRGTILLATEGINGTIASSREGIDAVLAMLRSDPRLANLDVKEAITPDMPFERMKVKLKREIVTFGMPEANPAKRVGTYVPPKQWNQLISDPDVLLIDTRNEYEVDIGSFRGAENPHIHSFREFPDYIHTHLDPSRHRKVAMFCTGGIRCEKATSYLLNQGFEQVYHLQGGILKYLEEIPQEQSLWDGECFVFDQRVAVKHGLEPGSYDLCYACGHPISEAEKRSPHYQPNISCPYCWHSQGS